ncbi:hypothetical protein F442_10838, partial [Phytophthora nicotianae P10297]
LALVLVASPPSQVTPKSALPRTRRKSISQQSSPSAVIVLFSISRMHNRKSTK